MSGAVRVETKFGKNSVILVAPHGPNDINTDIIVDSASDVLKSYAVINRGFERSDEVDSNNDKANCNKINHIKTGAPYEEFLKPILKFRNSIKKRIGVRYNLPDIYDKRVWVFNIHGAGDKVHTMAGEKVSCIIGYGRGNKQDSLTCELWLKNMFSTLFKSATFSAFGEVYEGMGGGRYAGRSTQNLNQYFRKHDLDPWVDCMQLEIPYSHRSNENRANLMGVTIAQAISDMLIADPSLYSYTAKAKFI